MADPITEVKGTTGFDEIIYAGQEKLGGSSFGSGSKLYPSSEGVFQPSVISSFLQARTSMSSQFEQEINQLRARLSQFGMPESQINAMVQSARTQFSSSYGKLLASEATAIEAIKQQRKQAKSSFLQGILGTVLGAVLPVPQSAFQGTMTKYVTKAMESQFGTDATVDPTAGQDAVWSAEQNQYLPL